MSDFIDPDVITEEIDTGANSSAVTASPTEEFEFGSAVAKRSEDVSSVSQISSKNTASLPPIQPASDDQTSLDNLRAVSSVFEGGCKTLTELVKGTGLPQQTVLACLNWLKDNGLIAVSSSFYCTIDNVASLQSQLKACQSCIAKK